MATLDIERIAKLETQVEGIKEDVAAVKDDIKELHSRITTGNREILDKIDSMDRRLEVKMNTAAEVSKEQHEIIQKEIRNDVEKISSRVNILEQWRWMIVGAALLAGYLLAHVDIINKFIG